MYSHDNSNDEDEERDELDDMQLETTYEDELPSSWSMIKVPNVTPDTSLR